MKKYKNMTPEGFFDVLFPESYKKKLIETKIREVFLGFGYFEIESPLMEYSEVFGNEFLDNLKAFKLIDKQGKILALRPDMTMPIARVISSKLKKAIKPLRIFYSDKIFRSTEAYGKSKEVHQEGIELIGVSSSKADAEALIIAIEALKSSGLEKFQLDIGQVAFFKSIVDRLGLSSQEYEYLRELIDKKDKLGVGDFLEDKEISENDRDILLNLSTFYGSFEVLENVKGKCIYPDSIDALNQLEEVYRILKNRGYEEYISVDLGMVNRLNYYTGIIFRGYTFGTGYPILTGGRYDNLLGTFGEAEAAVGFSINLNELLTAINRQKIEFDLPVIGVLIGGDKENSTLVFDISNRFRKNACIVEEDLLEQSFLELKEVALKKKIKMVLYIKNNREILIKSGNEQEKEMKIEEFINEMEAVKWSI